jgi:hypothetical protein
MSELCSKAELDELALNIYSETRIGYDPIFDLAKSYCEDGATTQLQKAIVSILYRVGAIGVKLQARSRYQFAHLDHPLLPVSQIPDEDVALRVHPMLHAAFRIQ